MNLFKKFSQERRAKRAEARAEILDGAVYLLKTHGWTTGTMHSSSGQYCMVGAIRAAGAGVDFPSHQLVVYRGTRDVEADLVRFLDLHPKPGDQTMSLTAYNDGTARDPYKVISTLRAAASALRNGEL